MKDTSTETRDDRSASIMPISHEFIVGTFNTNPKPDTTFTPSIYTLSFTAPDKLTIVSRSEATSAHSWLHLTPADPENPSRPRNLYATAWSEPATVVAYSVPNTTTFNLLGAAPINSRSGYVTATSKALYTAGGATGEVFALDPETGGFLSPSKNPSATTNGHTAPAPIQNLSFVDTSGQKDDGSVLDFGGLRHGAHSADLSPNERALYIADIGRNCIWTYAVDPTSGELTLGEKHISPRKNDGPRHVWPHPNGKYVYCLQEHTSMVDVFSCDESGTKLKHEQGVRIIPADKHEGKYWADEVRTSLSHGDKPRYMYASTRGLEAGTKGYVAVYGLTEEGRIVEGVGENGLLDMWETPTSGGWANAVQPGPTVDGVEYVALTDSEEGLVMVLGFNGKQVTDAGRVKLEDGVAGAATAVWF